MRLPCIVTASGTIIIQGKLSPFNDTLNFLLDTGSDGASLDSTLTEKYLLPAVLSRDSIIGIGGKKRLSYIDGQALHIGQCSFTGLRFHVNDYSFISRQVGIEIAGILGRPFLERYVIEINYDKKTVNFYHSAGFAYGGGGLVIPMNAFALPTIAVTTQDRWDVEAKFIFDLGAEQNLMINRAFLLDQGMLAAGATCYPFPCEGLGGGQKIFLTTLKRLRIGGYTFKDVPVSVFDDQTHLTRYPVTSGIIGIGILRRFNIWLNYGAREIQMQPNRNFQEPFNYTYTGLSFDYDSTAIFVSQVQVNSPGDLAGFRPGDQIIAINGDRSLDSYGLLNLLTHGTGSSKVLISRNGNKMKLRLKLLSILKDK